MKFPVVIGSNCCAGNYYHNFLNIPFYSPFIWCVTPYDAIYKLLTGWNTISWKSIKISPNPTRDLTLTLTLNNNIPIHFVHYFYSKAHQTPFIKGASVFYKEIHKYLAEKYCERVKRMLAYGDMQTPYFIIHEENYGNDTCTEYLEKIIQLKSPFKRFVITHSKNLSNINPDENCNYVFDSVKKLPEPMILQYGNQISDWFGINPHELKSVQTVVSAH